jgi:hypothetical protein
MRHRRPSPLVPFDAAPPKVVEAAKRLYQLVRSSASVGGCLPVIGTWFGFTANYPSPRSWAPDTDGALPSGPPSQHPR